MTLFLVLAGIGYLMIGREDAGSSGVDKTGEASLEAQSPVPEEGGAFSNEMGRAELWKIPYGPAAAPEALRWSKDCNGSCTIYADDGRVYVMHSTDEDDASLFAYATSDGRAVWHVDGLHETDNVQVLGKVIAIGNQGTDGDRTIALSASSGKTLYKSDANSYATHYGTKDVLLLQDGNSEPIDGYTMAVNLHSGQQIWKVKGEVHGICQGHVVAVEHTDDDYLRVVSYDVSTGNQEQSLEKGESNVSSVCSNDGIFVLRDGEISAYQFDSTKRSWSAKVSDAWGGEHFAAGIGLVLLANPDGVRALSAGSGKEEWSIDGLGDSAPSDENQVYALPVSASRVLVWDRDRQSVVDSSSGEAKGSLGRSRDAEIDTTKGEYVVNGNVLSFYDFKTLDEKWSADLSDVDTDDGVSGMAVGGGYVFVVTGDEIQAYK